MIMYDFITGGGMYGMGGAPNNTIMYSPSAMQQHQNFSMTTPTQGKSDACNNVLYPTRGVRIFQNPRVLSDYKMQNVGRPYTNVGRP